jgi:uncharacterized RDD family membrane protein YckC
MNAIIRAMDEAPPLRPAGFWIRAAALGIDLLVLALVQRSFDWIAAAILGPAVEGVESAHGSVGSFTLVFFVAYTTVLHAVAGQTIGKSLVGIRVVGVDGAPLAAGPSFLRCLAWFLSMIPLGLGYFMAGLRRDKRALHDLIAASRVEHVARRRVTRRPVSPRAPVGTLQDPAVTRSDSEPGA